MLKKVFENVTVFALAIIIFAASFACAKTGEGEEGGDDLPSFSVLLYGNDECFDIEGDNKVEVRRGDDAKFVLKMKNDYFVQSVTASSGTIDAEIINGTDKTTIVVRNVRYRLSLTANCLLATTHIDYHANGGEFIDGSDNDKPYTVGYELKSIFRPNTEIGTDRIKRDGYVLLGWNTKEDGSGEHIGLGSRATVEKGKTLDLYAEWIKENGVEDFTFKKYAVGYTVTSYSGDDETVVVPKKYMGRDVDTVARGVFSNNDKLKTVVFSENIKVVADGVFENCSVKEIYFYDNIEYISDNSFVNCKNFTTVHVNAIEPPRYGKNIYAEYNFADKYDLLILNKNVDKVVLFGGSGTFMSVDARAMENDLIDGGINKTCLNMAVNGWFNGPAQLDMISPYLKNGDVFLHIPETSSPFSVCYYTSMTPENPKFSYNKLRLYYCLEANYDLISLINIKHVTDFFDGFTLYNEERAEKDPTSYTDYKTGIYIGGEYYENDLAYMDDRGSWAFFRPKGHTMSLGEADIVPEYISDANALARLNAYYDDFSARGVKVCLSTAAVNADTLLERLENPGQFDEVSEGGELYYGRPQEIPAPDYESLEVWVATYERAMTANLHGVVILPLSRTLYHDDDYFEPDYHLADPASAVYTGDLAKGLIGVLGGK